MFFQVKFCNQQEIKKKFKSKTPKLPGRKCSVHFHWLIDVESLDIVYVLWGINRNLFKVTQDERMENRGRWSRLLFSSWPQSRKPKMEPSLPFYIISSRPQNLHLLIRMAERLKMLLPTSALFSKIAFTRMSGCQTIH